METRNFYLWFALFIVLSILSIFNLYIFVDEFVEFLKGVN